MLRVVRRACHVARAPPRPAASVAYDDTNKKAKDNTYRTVKSDDEDHKNQPVERDVISVFIIDGFGF